MQDRCGKAVLHGKVFPNKKPDQLARTGFWLALAVFVCLPAFTGGARKLISNRRSSKVTRPRFKCQI
jgi:hypothetical protein